MTAESLMRKHDNCPVVIIRVKHKYQGVIPGLYCATHGKWIKWLTPSHAQELIDMGVEDLGTKE
jgi:hypothetical protein